MNMGDPYIWGIGSPIYHGWNIDYVRKSEMTIVVMIDKTT
jgi:hypothetical protein